MAIASLVMGLIWLYWIGSILALVFGYIAKNQIDRERGRLTGRGMATAGIVLGWLEIGALVLGVVVGVVVYFQH
jgi:ABC-type phosphate transport system permease subunit